MKNKKKLTILVIQLFVLIVFVFSYKSYTDTVVKPISVFMFANDLQEGAKIEEKDLVLTEVAANTYRKNMILASDASSIIGKYTTSRCFKDTICYTSQFGDLNTSNSMFASLDLTNTVLMSLSVDMNDVGGYLAPGDKINLIFTSNGSAKIIDISSDSNDGSNQGDGGNKETSESFTFSKTFMQDVYIYDVIGGNGFKYIYKTDRYNGELPTGVNVSDVATADNNSISYLLLIVSPEEAEEIKTRERVGDITVVKRFDETETHDTLGYVIGNYGKIFSGNANAETSSLQIISTIQDTDTQDDVVAENQTTAGAGSNQEQAQMSQGQGNGGENAIGQIGTENVE